MIRCIVITFQFWAIVYRTNFKSFNCLKCLLMLTWLNQPRRLLQLSCGVTLSEPTGSPSCCIWLRKYNNIFGFKSNEAAYFFAPATRVSEGFLSLVRSQRDSIKQLLYLDNYFWQKFHMNLVMIVITHLSFQRRTSPHSCRQWRRRCSQWRPPGSWAGSHRHHWLTR